MYPSHGKLENLGKLGKLGTVSEVFEVSEDSEFSPWPNWRPTLFATIFMHRQCCGDAQTRQHCLPTFLCIANVVEMHKQDNIVCQHCYASPMLWRCTNKTTLLANIVMHRQCCGDAQTRQHCLPTFLCIANVVEMHKQDNIVGQHCLHSFLPSEHHSVNKEIRQNVHFTPHALRPVKRHACDKPNMRVCKNIFRKISCLFVIRINNFRANFFP